MQPNESFRASLDALESRMLVPSPLEELHLPEFAARGIRLMIKRDDLIHPEISGNKWRKLKYNLAPCLGQSGLPLLTFGGAWSNHVLAVAAVASELGIRSTAVIRGEPGPNPSPVLRFAVERGVRLVYVDRQNYRRRHEQEFLDELIERLGPHHVVPEGGCNQAGLRGCREIIDEVTRDFDVVCCAVGTGTTLAGLVAGLQPGRRAIGFPVLKGGAYLAEEVESLLDGAAVENPAEWSLECDYHFGGYARVPGELESFTLQLSRTGGVPFEPVYTGKMMYGLTDLARTGGFRAGETVLVIHTGGLSPESRPATSRPAFSRNSAASR